MHREIPSNIDFEIINIQPINEFISDCEIKVFYTGKNRNGSYISKAVGNIIANSLPRKPIVAYYNEQIDDYEDHGQEMIINKNGIKFITKTVPFGAISETGPIVWKKFLDADGTEREYVVCKGFLWTGRYPHLNSVIERPKGQSMEFFPESVVGDWAKFDNDDREFFIFNEANISALCILGDDVEPCFEGSTIGQPEVLYSLKKDEFKQEFNNFMLELDKALTHNLEEGGTKHNMEKNKEITQETEFELENIEDVTNVEAAEEFTEVEEVIEVEDVIETTTADEFTEVEEVIEVATEEFANEEVVEEEIRSDNEFEILNDKFTQLELDYNILKDKYEILFNEKTEKEIADKTAICDKFNVLGDEILSDIKTNLSNYTIEELEDKLSAIAFKKGISFSLIDNQEGIITPVVPHNVPTSVPAWVQAVEARVNNK